MSDQLDVILMDKKLAFLSKTRTFLGDPKHLNGSVYIFTALCGTPSLRIPGLGEMPI